MKILFPTDLSEKSLNMIFNLMPKIVSKPDETEVILFHVVDHAHYGASAIGDVNKIMVEDAHSKLETQKKKFSEILNINIHIRVREGFFERELKWTVEKMDPDLVVLISKAKHGILKFVAGQKSLDFIGELSAPLLIVPENYELNTITKMGLAIDKNESPTLETLWKIRKLSTYFNCEVKLFHVSTEKNSATEFYQNISNSMGFGDIEIVKEGNVLDGIKFWCQDNEIEVLVSMTHPKGFFKRLSSGSVTRDLVKENVTTLLIISQ